MILPARRGLVRLALNPATTRDPTANYLSPEPSSKNASKITFWVVQRWNLLHRMRSPCVRAIATSAYEPRFSSRRGAPLPGDCVCVCVIP